MGERMSTGTVKIIDIQNLFLKSATI
jgi:hypothetical protein